MADDPTDMLATIEELRQLPHWALVAYAVRAARRVQPLYKGKGVTPEHAKAVDQAIQFTELSARTGRVQDSTVTVRIALAANAAAATTDANFASTIRAAGAAAAAQAAARAALAVDDASVGAADGAHEAAVQAASDAIGNVYVAARADFKLLLSLSRREKWTDDTPVDVNILGPLWWGEEPEWWPKTEPDDRPIDVYFDTREFTPDQIGDALTAFSAMYSALSGEELIIEHCGTFDTAEALTPAGGDR